MQLNLAGAAQALRPGGRQREVIPGVAMHKPFLAIAASRRRKYRQRFDNYVDTFGIHELRKSRRDRWTGKGGGWSLVNMNEPDGASSIRTSFGSSFPSTVFAAGTS